MDNAANVAVGNNLTVAGTTTMTGAATVGGVSVVAVGSGSSGERCVYSCGTYGGYGGGGGGAGSAAVGRMVLQSALYSVLVGLKKSRS